MDILDKLLDEIKRFGVYNLSDATDIAVSTIYTWINKHSIPSLINAQKCANAMGLELLLFDKENI
jgi:hypothetical protein